MITSIQLGNKTHDILHRLHQVQAKSLLLTSWVSFRIEKRRVGWTWCQSDIFQTVDFIFFVFNWSKCVLEMFIFKLELFFELKRGESDELGVKMIHFSNCLLHILVQMGSKMVHFHVEVVSRIEKKTNRMNLMSKWLVFQHFYHLLGWKLSPVVFRTVS